MDPAEMEQRLKLAGIFMPGAHQRLNSLHSDGKRVVHYTSAEVIAGVPQIVHKISLEENSATMLLALACQHWLNE
jgi:hypothetical protein